jgi:hypothetical protein
MDIRRVRVIDLSRPVPPRPPAPQPEPPVRFYWREPLEPHYFIMMHVTRTTEWVEFYHDAHAEGKYDSALHHSRLLEKELDRRRHHRDMMHSRHHSSLANGEVPLANAFRLLTFPAKAYIEQRFPHVWDGCDVKERS